MVPESPVLTEHVTGPNIQKSRKPTTTNPWSNISKIFHIDKPSRKMKLLVPLSTFLTVAVFQNAICASLEAADKQEKDAEHADELTALQKIDQMEFEAAQKAKAVQMNVTEEQNEGSHHLEKVQDKSDEEHAEDDETTEAAGNVPAAATAHAESSEESDEVEVATEASSSLDGVSKDPAPEPAVLE